MAAAPVRIRLIVPTRNSHRLLPRLVASLQEQTLRQWRLSFIDGASNAEHRAWLEDLCHRDPRFEWHPQEPDQVGIFGAMNQGFALAQPGEWLLFWGSDDWAAGPEVLEEAWAQLLRSERAGQPADLLVNAGRYVHLAPGEPPRPARRSAFHWRHSYRRSLLLGSTPPHQATLIGPGARARLARYAPGFRLSADLDYFLQLSAHPDLAVVLRDLELVHMGDGGISGQQTRRRLQEVRCAYRRAFGLGWAVPFLLRYLYRVGTVVIQRQRATTSRQ
jgi:glycosyltransferase involved in cell wall biosynthesis